MRQLVILLVVVALGIAGFPAGAQMNQTKVEARDNEFVPPEITAKVGDTITFTNAGQAPHTATAQGIFDTGNINPGESKPVPLQKAGTIDYVCLYHPGMKGKITVAGGPGQPAPPGAPAGGAASPAPPSPPPSPQGQAQTEQEAPEGQAKGGGNPVKHWWALQSKLPIGLRLFAPLALMLLLGFAGLAGLSYIRTMRKMQQG